MAKITTHEVFEARIQPKAGSDRSFGLVMGSFFALLGLWPLRHMETPHWWWLAAALAFVTLAFTVPRALHPVNLIWFRVGLLLHKVTTPVMMGALFYTTITPIGLLMRFFGRNPLTLKPDPTAATYWIARDPPGPPSQSMKNQF